MTDRLRLAKFVPASGAATRMFKDLTASAPPSGNAESPSARSPVTNGDRLIESLPKFAFYEALRESLERRKIPLDSLLESRETQPILDCLLNPQGLDYKRSPKGMILFHNYPEAPRTALEDQLWEGANYLTSPGGKSRFHFTVTGDHLGAFQKQVERISEAFEAHFDITLQVELSTQSPSTDTIALDSTQRPVRRPDGSLLLRPAGHGALLENLQDLDADVVFVKNVDNVAHERLHQVSIHWKRILAGHFVEIQEQIFEILSALESRPDAAAPVDRALKLLEKSIAVRVPTEILDSPHSARYEYALNRLDRPLRVCGMVKNEGEPGGGPFWLPDKAGGISGQIIEAAQVDLASPAQRQIWQSSTHFNPVDLVCGLYDRHGHRYHLADFVDPTTSIVAQKSHAGQPLRALERPGLWNGSMAWWNTAFVEVPLATFTPVKTVFDLLRPEHQP